MPEIDHEYTHEIVCPHCGHTHSDSWEFGATSGEECGESECGNCSKPFHWSRHIRVSYSTKDATRPRPPEASK